MGYEPTTHCAKCGDAHDVYTEGLCESCEEEDKQTTPHPFDENKDGVWCPNCGDLIRAPWNNEELNADSECPECGFPEITDEWMQENV